MTIQEIRDCIQQQKHIAAKAAELRERQRSLQEAEADLRAIWQKEESDVNRLEAGSLTGFWYAMTGRKEHKLEQEKQEAYAAAVKHRTAVSELDAVTRELELLVAKQRPMCELEEQLAQAMNEKLEWLKANCPEQAVEILQAEERIAELNGQINEIQEAITAGKRAEAIAAEVKSSLDSAEGWGTWDMLGGGMFATMAKHSHLDSAQQKVNELQTCLSRFRTELTDVELEANMQVQVDGFLCFADYFWDGLFADWAVQSKISQSLTQITQVQAQIRTLLMKLQKMEQDAEAELTKKKVWLEEYVRLADN